MNQLMGGMKTNNYSVIFLSFRWLFFAQHGETKNTAGWRFLDVRIVLDFLYFAAEDVTLFIKL